MKHAIGILLLVLATFVFAQSREQDAVVEKLTADLVAIDKHQADKARAALIAVASRKEQEGFPLIYLGAVVLFFIGVLGYRAWAWWKDDSAGDGR